ncbi:tyrosine-type recombinase/integrase [Xylanimonas ulmi]|uniref:Site-specific recombinase XerD n=1 Tax=Xylanimonas ulmi TaxID=228973 RepID=A0A4Q7M3C4_9MICO|nr:site-specific integrase [Xylanibacterium ulmi]RZS60439.1 site-specific recombinase XerD [Xylanibacterium ulmi]
MPAPEKRTRNGKTRWLARYRDPEGKQRSKTFDRQVDAQTFLDETVVSVRRGTYLDPDAGRETFRAHAEAWLAMQTFNTSTREVVEHRLVKHVYPVLGSKQLAQIKPSTVKAWLAGLKVSKSYARTIHANVSSILAAAVEDEKVAKNAARTKASRPGKVARRRIVPWSAEQVAAAHRALAEQYRILVTLGAGLGMRQGELFGLSPDDVDFLRGEVHVRRQVKVLAGNKLVFSLPKGEKTRDVPLPPSVRAALALHLKRHPAVAVSLPWDGEPGDAKHGETLTVPLVTTSREKKPLNRNHFNTYHWHAVADAVKLTEGQEGGMHQLRHFYASVLLDAGESIKVVAEHLGHSDPGFTLRTYTHLMPASGDRTKKAVDAALSCVPVVYPDASVSL